MLPATIAELFRVAPKFGDLPGTGIPVEVWSLKVMGKDKNWVLELPVQVTSQASTRILRTCMHA